MTVKSSTKVTPVTSGKSKDYPIFLPVSDFRALLERAAAKYPSKQAFAKELGITPSRFSRVLRGDYSMEVVNCLRLAKLSGEQPSDVLTAAGKRDVADLIEHLYGDQTLAEPERTLLSQWAHLTGQQQSTIRSLIRELLPAKKKRRA